MRRFKLSTSCLATLCFAIVLALPSWAFATAPTAAPPKRAPPAQRTLCVFDPGGTMGDYYKTAQDYAIATAAWGVALELVAYQDEAVASSDFLNGKCDAVLLTGVRTQQMNRKTYSMEAMGLLPEYDDLRKAINLLTRPKAAKLCRSGAYETVGIFPGGGVYLFVRDRKYADVKALAGAKIATLSFDDASRTMVNFVSATPVLADTGTFASLFNEGSVDVAYAPALAYAPFELQRGIGKKGGIMRFTLTQMTIQIVTHHAKFPSDFGLKSRAWAAKRFDSAVKLIERSERAIPAKSWIDVTPAQRKRYDEILRQVRGKLTKAGSFDATMVKLLERLAAR